MRQLTATDLKKHGVSAIETALAKQSVAIISVHSKTRYVVMDIAEYNYFCECELDAAIAQSRIEIAAGQYTTESVAEHMASLEAELAK